MDENHTIWIERYRPAKLADMVGQKEIVERLQSYVRSGSMPHLLFTGSAGVGKTTAAVALAREFFGETWHTNFRELNASDERGIDVVRNQIEQFARTSPLENAAFKILFLDEADALTTDAQAALRRTMEKLTPEPADSSSPVTTPRRSSTPSRAGAPSTGSGPSTAWPSPRRSAGFAAKEGLTVAEKALDAIVYIAQGDMRKAINALQGAAILSPIIEEKLVYEITANARPEEIRESPGPLPRGRLRGGGAGPGPAPPREGDRPRRAPRPVLPRAGPPEEWTSPSRSA